MRKLFRHIKNSWYIYIAVALLLLMLIKPIQSYLNSNYTKDIDCTVVSAETIVRSTGAAGKPSSSARSIIETEECGELRFYSPVIDGLGMKEVTDQLVPGERYKFVVGRYVLFNNRPGVQEIKEMNGSPVDFASR